MIVQTPEEIGCACIYREADACHLYITGKAWRKVQMGCPKEILVWTLKFREKRTDKVTGKERQ